MKGVTHIGVVALLVLASCSSSGTSTPSDLSPAAAAKWNAYCAFRCLPASYECPPTTCMAGVAEEGPLIEFVDCQMAKACDANDDDCVAGAGTTDAEREAFTARCVAALSISPPQECAIGFPEPAICTIIAYPIIRKEHMRAVDACLTLPCEALKTCVEAAVEPLNCW